MTSDIQALILQAEEQKRRLEKFHETTLACADSLERLQQPLVQLFGLLVRSLAAEQPGSEVPPTIH